MLHPWLPSQPGQKYFTPAITAAMLAQLLADMASDVVKMDQLNKNQQRESEKV